MAHKRTSNIQFLCVVFVCSAIFAILIAPPVTAQSLFKPMVTYDGGGYLYSIAVADVNGDHKPDIVVANANGVGVLLGNGDGTFQPVVKYNSGATAAVFVVVADVNGDGKPDLVVANTGGGTNDDDGSVGVLLGNGDGTFRPAVVYDSGGQGATSAVVADFNQDGKLDLLVSNGCLGVNCTSGPWVGVLLGNGDGTFQAVVTYDNNGLMPHAVSSADINGDGKPDMVVANFYPYSLEPQSIGVRMGNGDGTFQPEAFYGTNGFNGASSVAAGDVNLDGKVDLLVMNYGFFGVVAVLLGNGDGTFRPAITYATGLNPNLGGPQIAVADLNADAKPDLIAADYSGAVDVLLGNGDGTFQAAASYLSGGYGADAVVVADLNGDGSPDVVVANDSLSGYGGPGTVGVLLNNTPFCTNPPVVTLSIAPTSLWPPNGKKVPVTVSGTISDTGCTVETAAYAVTDEYGQVQPAGPLTLGPGGAYSFTVLLQASRLGTDFDGRLYTITISASNNAGRYGLQSGTVVVPHDQGH
jgi:hypothetical protein